MWLLIQPQRVMYKRVEYDGFAAPPVNKAQFEANRQRLLAEEERKRR